MAEGQLVHIKKTLTQKCAIHKIPVSGTFELTARCNLNCRMCYVRLNQKEVDELGKELTQEEWIEVAKQAKEAGMLFLLLTGGEPTLRKDFIDIYRNLAQMGFSISINTNGTLFTDEIKAIFSAYPPAQINITLYGTTKEQYKKFCGSESAYFKVMDTLDWLTKENILTHLNATMTPNNVEDWEKYEAFAKARNLELRMTTYCFPPTRRAARNEFSRLTPEQAGELSVQDILYREGIQAILKKAKQLDIPIQNSCKLDLGDPLQCLAAKSQFWICWDGSMVPCGMLSIPKENLIQTQFKEAWDSLCKKSEEIRLCKECSACKEKNTCMNCAAVTFNETGRFDGKPIYACKMNAAYRNALKKYAQMK